MRPRRRHRRGDEEDASCDLNEDERIFGPEEEACAAADHEPATKAEVIDHIIKQCPNNYPTEGKEEDYFEASARKTLNEQIPDAPFVHEEGSHNLLSSHPQLTNKVDGYREAAVSNGRHVINVITAIMESKFGPPTNNIEYGQSTTHIRDLAKMYSRIPPDEGFGIPAPLYIIVSNSQWHNESIGKFGSDTHDPNLNLVGFAKERGVSAMHLYVTRDENTGKFYLEGDVIGAPLGSFHWLQDWFKDQQMDYHVSCMED